MKNKRIPTDLIALAFLTVSVALALAAQDGYALKVPNGLAFSEFRGYEAWQVVSISQDGDLIAAILAKPVMPGTLDDKLPQGNDAKCGFACHTSAKTRDYVFTDYGHR